MKILFAITVSFFLLTSTETEYKKITDKTEIQSLAKKYDQTYYNLTCENSHLKLLKKEGAAILECAEEKGVLSIEKEGEETNSSHQNTLLLKILETEYKNGVDIEKLEVYSDEESMLICITLLDDSVVAFFKKRKPGHHLLNAILPRRFSFAALRLQKEKKETTMTFWSSLI